MEYVSLRGVHKSFYRKYGAPTLKTHMAPTKADKVDHALVDVDLSVSSGESVVLLGRRRSGRSTLLNVVSGLYRPDSGTVLVRGRPTGTSAMSAGFTPTLSVADNLAMNGQFVGMPVTTIEERRKEILEFAGIKPAEARYPLNEITGRSRQRLAYSILLHARPDVFIADDKVVIGDTDFKESSLAFLEQMRDAGHVLLMATNNRKLARRLCTRAVVMNDGEIVFDGGLKPAYRTLRELRADG